MEPVNIANPNFGTAKQTNSTMKRLLVPCGHCAICLSKKRSVWSFRLSYELRSHSHCYFLTLTYSDDNLHSFGLSKMDIQKFFKRLRKRSGQTLRYFAVGEYGSKTYRPHYHVIIFSSARLEDHINKSWTLGFAHIGFVTKKSISYVTKYLITTGGAVSGKNPPFTLMSRKPMLGYKYIEDLKEWHASDSSRNFMPDLGGVRLPMHRGFKEKLKQEGVKFDSYSYEFEVLDSYRYSQYEHFQNQLFKKITKNDTF